MTSSSRSGNVVALLPSCFCCLCAITMLIFCLFSTDYRYVSDMKTIRGTRSFGLIRYCFESDKAIHQLDSSNGDECYLRTKAPPNEDPVNFKDHYGPFEIATLILLSVAIGCGFASICFAICAYFTKFGAFAHSITVLAAAVCAAAGFAVYTYFNELRENQTLNIRGDLFKYHYGWAYYVTGAAAGVLLIGFICSLLGSAYVVVHYSQKNRHKVDAIELGTRL